MLDDQDDEDYTPEATDRPKHAKPVRPAQNFQQYVSRTEEEAPRAPRPFKPSRSEIKPEETTTHPRSLWVCDRCFKYMPMESAYVTHTVSPKTAPNVVMRLFIFLFLAFRRAAR
jgi:hypothetical protein